MRPTWASVSQVAVSGVQDRVQHGLKEQEVTLEREEINIITPMSHTSGILDSLRQVINACKEKTTEPLDD